MTASINTTEIVPSLLRCSIWANGRRRIMDLPIVERGGRLNDRTRYIKVRTPWGTEVWAEEDELDSRVPAHVARGRKPRR